MIERKENEAVEISKTHKEEKDLDNLTLTGYIEEGQGKTLQNLPNELLKWLVEQRLRE